MTATGKELYEHLEVLFNRVEDGFAEASFDAVLNELIRAAEIAARHDGTGRADDVHRVVRSFQRRYRKPDDQPIGAHPAIVDADDLAQVEFPTNLTHD